MSRDLQPKELFPVDNELFKFLTKAVSDETKSCPSDEISKDLMEIMTCSEQSVELERKLENLKVITEQLINRTRVLRTLQNTKNPQINQELWKLLASKLPISFETSGETNGVKNNPFQDDTVYSEAGEIITVIMRTHIRGAAFVIRLSSKDNDTIFSKSIDIFDADRKLYSFKLCVEKRGIYFLNVTINGSNLKNSPCCLRVIPNKTPCLQKSYLTVPANVFQNVQFGVLVHLRDKFGNIIREIDNSRKVRISTSQGDEFFPSYRLACTKNSKSDICFRVGVTFQNIGACEYLFLNDWYDQRHSLDVLETKAMFVKRLEVVNVKQKKSMSFNGVKGKRNMMLRTRRLSAKYTRYPHHL